MHRVWEVCLSVGTTRNGVSGCSMTDDQQQLQDLLTRHATDVLQVASSFNSHKYTPLCPWPSGTCPAQPTCDPLEHLHLPTSDNGTHTHPAGELCTLSQCDLPHVRQVHACTTALLVLLLTLGDCVSLLSYPAAVTHVPFLAPFPRRAP